MKQLSQSDIHARQRQGGVRSTKITSEMTIHEIWRTGIIQNSDKDEGLRVLPDVTDEGVASLYELPSCTSSKALVSAPKVCHKGYRIISDSKPGQSGQCPKRSCWRRGSQSSARPPVSNTAETQRNQGKRIDASASQIVERTLLEEERNEPSAFSQ